MAASTVSFSSSTLIRHQTYTSSIAFKNLKSRDSRKLWQVRKFHDNVVRRNGLVLPRNSRLLHLADPLFTNRVSFLLPCPSLQFLLGFRPAVDRSCLARAMSSFGSEAEESGHHYQSPQTKTVRVVVKGRVQGVFYRDWTTENARQLGLKGWVRNRRDGSVEALFHGESEKVKEMEQRCRAGPPAAMVTRLDVFPSDEDPGTDFVRKTTC